MTIGRNKALAVILSSMKCQTALSRHL